MHTEGDVPNPDGSLVPGAYAEATLVLEEKGNVLVIPPEAIEHEGTEPQVRVLNRSGQIGIRSVTLGPLISGSIEVLSGLAEGDRVVVSRSGESVEIRRWSLRQ